ncbi:MAG: glycosyltransferase [Desulfobacula sp.]|nr:glycosyltransferase [Desulfobacula sp.]
MKVLFVSSGNSVFGISPIISNQKDSLVGKGLEIQNFLIEGKGISGYLKAVFKLRKYLKNGEFDVIHAHYSFSGFVASLAGCQPLVVSLMGSDTKRGALMKSVIKSFNSLFWSACIVKSRQMKVDIGITKAHIMPNGVDFQKFYEVPKEEAREKLKYKLSNKYILFASDPVRPEKNFILAESAIHMLKRKDIEVHYIKNIPNEELVWHYGASDITLLTSIREGSPNVIKEAMACNCPIVATNVGDVKEIIGKTEGCYVTSFDENDVAEKLDLALNFGKKTQGRKGIENLRSEIIADKLNTIYQQIIKNHTFKIKQE